MEIELPPSLFDPVSESKIITNLSNQVSETIRTTRSGDIERATRLATYWYAIGEKSRAIELLLSFNGKVASLPHNRGLWFEYGHSIVLLYELIEEAKDIKQKLSVLQNDRIHEDSPIKYYEEYIAEDLPEALSSAELESQKYQCEIYAVNILCLLYHKHMLPLEDDVYAKQVMDTIEKKLVIVKKYLLEALIKKRKTNMNRLSIHPQD